MVSSPFSFSSDDIKIRLDQIEFIKDNFLDKYDPVTNKRRVSKKYKHIVDDYHKVIKCYNQSVEIQKLMIEIITESLTVLSANIKKIEDLEKNKTDLSNQITIVLKDLQSEKNDHAEILSKLGTSFKEMSLICNIVTQKSKVKDR